MDAWLYKWIHSYVNGHIGYFHTWVVSGPATLSKVNTLDSGLLCTITVVGVVTSRQLAVILVLSLL